MRFTSPLVGQQGDGSGWCLWAMAEPLVFEIEDLRVILVDKGFVSDGASIPRFMWAIYPPFGPWARAGVLHDYLCCRIAAGIPHREAMTRVDADRWFFDALKSLGQPPLRCWILWFGARMGTWFGVRTTMIDHNDKLRGIWLTPAV